MRRANERLLLFVFTASVTCIAAAIVAAELHKLLSGLGAVLR